jgi:hypothetical protein
VRAAVAGSLAAVLIGLGLSGCVRASTADSDTIESSRHPDCPPEDGGAAANGVILMAQSVPSASWVPCMSADLPSGWNFEGLRAENGTARFTLTSDRNGGTQTIDIRLDPSCDTQNSTEIHSNRRGMQKFLRITQTVPSLEGQRYYVFEGGCITFDLALGGENRGEPLALVDQVVDAVSREDLRAQVHDESDGRLSLDPAGDG